MTEFNISEADFEEISEAEFNEGGSRGGSWKQETIKEYAKALVEKAEGKQIKVPIAWFYTNMREDAGTEVVKYASYYSRKVLIEAFESISAKAKVKTMGTKNSSTQGFLKISVIGY